MFFLTIEEQLRFDAAQAYYYKEEEWDELTEESYLDKEIHLRFIPETFHEAILSKKLFKKRKLHKRYNEWCEEVINRYYDKRNAQ